MIRVLSLSLPRGGGGSRLLSLTRRAVGGGRSNYNCHLGGVGMTADLPRYNTAATSSGGGHRRRLLTTQTKVFGNYYDANPPVVPPSTNTFAVFSDDAVAALTPSTSAATSSVTSPVASSTNLSAEPYYSSLPSASILKFDEQVSNSHNNSISNNAHGRGVTSELDTSMDATFRYADLFKFRPILSMVIRLVAEDRSLTELMEKRYIPSKVWLKYLMNSRRSILKSCTPFLEKYDNKYDSFIGACNSLSIIENFSFLMSPDSIKDEKDLEIIAKLKSNIFQLLAEEAEIELADDIVATKTLKSCSDLTIPHEWYPYARLLKRKIVYHGGPTNSGKTYQALQRLKQADPAKGGGIYCGPLRLLALEIYERLNREGVHCSLLTGQELREVPFSSHESCTVEMVRLDKPYDVAVIDEIQMIADHQRGWAWTRVLQGLHAREIHICGGLETFDVVKSLVESMGDDFEFHKYERLSTLKIADRSLEGDYSKIEPGDCVVAFSRADIFSIRKQIERLTKHKCAVIYGQLPPEIRSEQARLFNEGKDGFDVLVASDAIGMGLNLNIRRIIFHSVNKYTRGSEGAMEYRFVEPSHVKQIGGRAGRLSSQYKEGVVTAWQNADLAYVRAVMGMDVPQLDKVGIFPSVDMIQRFSQSLQKYKIDSAVSMKQSETEDSVLLKALIGEDSFAKEDAKSADVEDDDSYQGHSDTLSRIASHIKPKDKTQIISYTTDTDKYNLEFWGSLNMDSKNAPKVGWRESERIDRYGHAYNNLFKLSRGIKSALFLVNYNKNIQELVLLSKEDGKAIFAHKPTNSLSQGKSNAQTISPENFDDSAYMVENVQGKLYNFAALAGEGVSYKAEVSVFVPFLKKAEDVIDVPLVDSNGVANSSSSNSSNSSISNEASPSDSKVRLGLLIDRFVDSSRTDGRYFICDYIALLAVSNWLHPIPLSLEDRFIFANAPCNLKDPMNMNMLYTFAATYALNRPVAINIRLPRGQPRSFMDFQDLCGKHSVLDMYSWLSRRFPKLFIERDICTEQQQYGQKLIQETLFSGKMQHEYSHSEKGMQKYKNKDIESILPPLSYGLEIRDKTREFLLNIPQSEWAIFPHSLSENSKKSSTSGDKDKSYSSNYGVNMRSMSKNGYSSNSSSGGSRRSSNIMYSGKKSLQ